MRIEFWDCFRKGICRFNRGSSYCPYKKAVAARDEAITNFNAKKESYSKDKSDIEKAKDKIIADFESGILDAENKLLATKSNLEEANIALSKTFVLSFGKKKDLKNRISSLESTISSLEDSLKDLKTKLSKAKRDKTVALKNLDKELSELEEKANKEKGKAEELENKLNEAKLDYEKATADLETKKKSYDSIKWSVNKQ